MINRKFLFVLKYTVLHVAVIVKVYPIIKKNS